MKAFMASFKEPLLAIAAIMASVFALVMVGVAHFADPTIEDLVRPFAGTLALGVGTFFLTYASRCMRNSSSNLGILTFGLALLVLGSGVVDIIITGASDFAKDLGTIVATGIGGFFAAANQPRD